MRTPLAVWWLHYTSTIDSEAALRLLVRQFRITFPSPDTLAGSSALYSLGAAMLADFTHPSAATRSSGVSEELVFLSPISVLVLPRRVT